MKAFFAIAAAAALLPLLTGCRSDRPEPPRAVIPSYHSAPRPPIRLSPQQDPDSPENRRLERYLKESADRPSRPAAPASRLTGDGRGLNIRPLQPTPPEALARPAARPAEPEKRPELPEKRLRQYRLDQPRQPAPATGDALDRVKRYELAPPVSR